VYCAGHPSYDLSWQWNSKTNKLRLLLKQLQPEDVFPNAVPVDILTTNGKRRFVLKPTGRRTVDEVKLDATPTTVNIDPDNTILKDARVSPQLPRRAYFRPSPRCDHGPKRWRYSPETMNALTISALTKLPLNSLSFPNQKL
jgi:hypothetical protein